MSEDEFRERLSYILDVLHVELRSVGGNILASYKNSVASLNLPSLLGVFSYVELVFFYGWLIGWCSKSLPEWYSYHRQKLHQLYYDMNKPAKVAVDEVKTAIRAIDFGSDEV